MKKNIIVLLTVSLFTAIGCKDKKAQDAPNQTQNVEVKKEEEEPKTAIYQKDSLYYLKYRLEIGKEYPLNNKIVEKKTIKMQGQSMNVSQETLNKTMFKPTEYKDGVYTFEVTTGDYSFVMKTPQGTQKIGTNSAKPSIPELAQQWELQNAIKGFKFIVKMDDLGNVKSVEGHDKIVEKIVPVLEKSIKDKKQRDEILAGYKQTFSNEGYQQGLQAVVMRFPEDGKKGLKIGEKWYAKNTQKVFRTLVSTNETEAKFDFTGDVPTQQNNRTEQGINYKGKLTGWQNGKITVDAQTGWIKKASIDGVQTMVETASKDGQSQSQTQTLEAHSYTN